MMRIASFLAILIATVGQSGAEECSNGAVFSVETNKAKFVVRRIGAIVLPSTGMPAFALELESPDGTELAYAYGQIKSYTFLTNLDFLESSELVWQVSLEFGPGDFFRFMEDSGKVVMFNSTFIRCR